MMNLFWVAEPRDGSEKASLLLKSNYSIVMLSSHREILAANLYRALVLTNAVWLLRVAIVKL